MPSATLKPKTEASTLKQAGLRCGSDDGYVVVFEGDDGVGTPPTASSCRRSWRAADTREETEALMREAMHEHTAILPQTGQPSLSPPPPSPSSASLPHGRRQRPRGAGRHASCAW
jgi:hypothetical protein